MINLDFLVMDKYTSYVYTSVGFYVVFLGVLWFQSHSQLKATKRKLKNKFIRGGND